MAENIVEEVRARYGEIAARGTAAAPAAAVAAAFGYTPEQLANIPAESNLGLSCGNPTAFASLRPGEVVVDLGSGGGLDVFLAAERVGPTGRVIGIDMTPAMIELARANAARGKDGRPIDHVEFHLAQIDRLPLPDQSVDCVLSNCVINLAPDKPAVFREVARVLRDGGRLAVSDIALKRPLPPELGNDVLAYVGCIAGAIPIEEYERGLRAAGFAYIHIIETGADLRAYALLATQEGPQPRDASGSALPVVSAGCCGPSESAGPMLDRRWAELLERYDPNEYAASFRIFAIK